MTKSIAVFVLLLALVVIAIPRSVRAQIGSMMDGGSTINEAATGDNVHPESIETVLQDLLTKQKVDTIQKLNCKQVGDDDLERLGEAVMEQQHPGQAHEVMDQMMGGEGSPSLRQMHLNMGSGYLGCGGDYGAGMTRLRQGFGGQVGSVGMMGGIPMMGLGWMMGLGNGLFGVSAVLAGLTWVALIIFLSAGTYFFIKQAHRK